MKIYTGAEIDCRLQNLKGYIKDLNNSFKNIEIFVKEGQSALVLKRNEPSIMFEFEHPLMIETFKNYIYK